MNEEIDNPIEKFKTAVMEHPTTLDVVSSLMDDKNIEMKTEIVNPYALDTLMMFAELFKDVGMEEIFNILNKWKDLLLKYMVSHKRLSRGELVEILKGYFTLEREKENKLTLTSNLAKMNQQSTF